MNTVIAYISAGGPNSSNIIVYPTENITDVTAQLINLTTIFEL